MSQAMSIMTLSPRVLRGRLACFAADRRGVSAIEFAMLAPLMLTLYIGAVEMAQAVSANRKVSLTARAVSDLVAQSTSVSSTDISNILNAAATVTAPFKKANLKVIVSSVKIDANKNATVRWSDALNTSPYSSGTPVTLPAGLQIASTYLVWAEVKYDYTPIIGGQPTDLFYKLTGTKTLHDTIYMRPRLADCVTRPPTVTSC